MEQPKYNHFLHGSKYEISVLDATIYFLIFVCIGMCIGGFIKYLEYKCNQITDYQRIQIKGLEHDVKIKVEYQ